MYLDLPISRRPERQSSKVILHEVTTTTLGPGCAALAPAEVSQPIGLTLVKKDRLLKDAELGWFLRMRVKVGQERKEKSLHLMLIDLRMMDGLIGTASSQTHAHFDSPK
jgi:hypothetical protein